ncbi:hypothetical protein EZV61_16020 [Corallincola luteus]|uniref:DUF5673 domain-containing protein n=1 Tax=Corallincola luteus TaxID=1775177 RepID=A0ABY2AHP9_9GAMM|nr:hypothetical protein [Corallincola luteus]TCI01776.1 hypothetical protein EZV61_16020 [Corallincola luteus]
MTNTIKKSPYLIILILSCLLFPLLESWFAGTLWGLKIKSPMFMHELTDKLRIIKLFLIVFSVYLLIAKTKTIKETLNNVIVSRGFIVSGYLLAAVQIPLLSLGILFSSISSDSSHVHKEQVYEGRSIYVYTADPGAMGTAQHYFYLKCPLPWHRYELTQIEELDWMYDFSFEVIANELVIIDNSAERKVHRLNVSKFKCGSQV